VNVDNCRIAVSTTTKLDIFPNPASEQLHISFYLNNVSDARVILTDLQGKVVLEVMDKGLTGINTQVIDIQNVAPGTYLMYVATDEFNIPEKIVIN
jgi:hypothetical protein